MPEGPFELNTTWPGICKEISQVVSEKDKDIDIDEDSPKEFFSANASEVGVAELWVEH